MRRISLIAVVMASLMSCDKQVNEQDCEASMICDASFAMVSIQFVDKDNNGVAVTNYSAINQRTLDTVYSSISATINTTPGTFIVVDDAYRKKLAEKGDNIKITGTHPSTNQTKSTTIKVAGGECTCHVRKISGVDKIVFD